jgi:hypothetical protein
MPADFCELAPWGQEEPDTPWTDHHESLARVWFQSQKINASAGDVGRAVQAAAKHNPFQLPFFDSPAHRHDAGMAAAALRNRHKSVLTSGDFDLLVHVLDADEEQLVAKPK